MPRCVGKKTHQNSLGAANAAGKCYDKKHTGLVAKTWLGNTTGRCHCIMLDKVTMHCWKLSRFLCSNDTGKCCDMSVKCTQVWHHKHCWETPRFVGKDNPCSVAQMQLGNVAGKYHNALVTITKLPRLKRRWEKLWSVGKKHPGLAPQTPVETPGRVAKRQPILLTCKSLFISTLLAVNAISKDQDDWWCISPGYISASLCNLVHSAPDICK